MKRQILTLSLALSLSACAGGGRMAGPLPRPHADPGMVVAADLAFGKGKLAAFRAAATPEAEIFTPRRVLSSVWLKGHPDPVAGSTWAPHLAWSSCDGTLAVTHGAWKNGKANGYYTTAWAWQPKDGGYKWVLDHGDRLDMALPAPEMIAAKTADCGGHPGVPLTAPEVGADMKQLAARDQSLQITSTVAPSGARRITVRMWDGKGFVVVLDEQVEASQ